MMHPFAVRRGVSLLEVGVTAATVAALVSVAVPMIGSARGDSDLLVSLNNLRILGEAHATYASEWEGRQWTVTPDDLSVRIHSYRTTYPPKIIPPARLGFDCEDEYYETSSGWALQQMWWAGNCSLGNFRAWNTGAFNQYVGGKIYDRTFWAPRDIGMPGELRDLLRQYLEIDCEWPGAGSSFVFPTYCMSIAAQVDPAVYRGPQDGGSQYARSLDFGHRTPNLASAKYPDLKTHMLEHFWLNNWPKNHDPFIPGTGGVPWYFNMSDRSEPATLFFDGSTRVLPNLEVLASNDIVVRQGEDSLWAHDIACFGSGGYFENYAFPPSDSANFEYVDMVPSHHVFTRDGILGRDTVLGE
jgi:hypothetical protein